MQTCLPVLSGLRRRARTFTLLGLLLAPVLRAAEDEVHTVALEARALAGSLDAFSQTTGIDVVSRSASLRGKRAPAVEGEYAANAALERILSESSLAYRFTGERTVAVTTPAQARADEPLDLEPVTLEGRNYRRVGRGDLAGDRRGGPRLQSRARHDGNAHPDGSAQRSANN